MITPLDIQNKQFKKSFRGYKEAEVDYFLDEIVEDYERLYKENIELKDKILVLNEQIKHYNNLEETLKDTLIVAQNTADDVILTAKQKAENIVEDAEIMAKELLIEANDKVKNIKEEYEYLQREIFIFKTRYKSFLESQIITIDEFYSLIEESSLDKREKQESEENLETEDIVEIDKDFKEGIDDLGA
ncbi:MAG: DivIVA domain-containing protein [Tissierellia bacterium]|nr:DivIVA domain-containing protein [Tissierellia bacterium]